MYIEERVKAFDSVTHSTRLHYLLEAALTSPDLVHTKPEHRLFFSFSLHFFFLFFLSEILLNDPALSFAVIQVPPSIAASCDKDVARKAFRQEPSSRDTAFFFFLFLF